MKSIAALDCSNEFVSRHIGPSDKDIAYMLETLGSIMLLILAQCRRLKLFVLCKRCQLRTSL